MNSTLKQVAKKLKEEKDQLISRIAALHKGEEKKKELEETPAVPPAWIDYGQKTDENAAEVSEFADNVSLQQSLADRLASINHALDAIEKGTYGVCRVCGKKIEEARMKVMPTSTRCLSCKQKNL